MYTYECPEPLPDATNLKHKNIQPTPTSRYLHTHCAAVEVVVASDVAQDARGYLLVVRLSDGALRTCNA